MVGLPGIPVALGLPIALAYRGVSVPPLAAVSALVAAAFAGAPLPGLYTQMFMTSAGGFIVSFSPLFLPGAIVRRMLDDSGAATAIAQGLFARLGGGQAILAVMPACAVLASGGVSPFAVAFGDLSDRGQPVPRGRRPEAPDPGRRTAPFALPLPPRT
ncbi:MAG: hypothetical protein NZM27_09665 [Acetobacteraceae bacterium]|nr:hypothetical protein [Acetobacteraceae bacterium]MDW8397903.1 hypothetical protein [Acetobacteraceae bacterium]